MQEVNASNFEAEVIKSNIPVLVDFWAPWCGPCRMIAPIVEKAAEDFKGRLKVVKLNTDESTQLAAGFGIMSIPTLMFFSGGKEVDRVSGYMTKESLASKINQNLSKK